MKVSIVTVCYNYGKYLSECMASVLAQTVRAEHIVVDPHSTDNTVEIVKLYGGRRLEWSGGFGLSSCKNYGVDNANGEYIVCLDADDRIHPRFVEKLLAKARPGIVVCPGLQEFDGGSNHGWPTGSVTYQSLLGGNQIFCASMYHWQDWDKAGRYDPNLDDLGYEDWDLWLRLTKNGCNVTVVPELLFYYRGDAIKGSPGSSTTHTIKRHEERMAYLRSKYPDHRF